MFLDCDDYDLVLRVLQDALDVYKPDSRALDIFFRDFISQYEHLNENDTRVVFDIFCECVQYEKVLQVVLDGFFEAEGVNLKRSQKNMYKVIVYIAYMRMPDVGTAGFEKFIDVRDIRKIHKLLQFITNDDHVYGWMRKSWYTQFSVEYVNDHIMGHIRVWMDPLKEIKHKLKARIDYMDKPLCDKMPPTEPKPFQLTLARPKSLPIPDVVSDTYKPKPPPKSLYELPKEPDAVLQAQVVNRKKGELKFKEASRLAFSCSNRMKPDKVISRLQEIIDEQEQKLDFNRPKANPSPEYMERPPPAVRLNAATIMREGNLLNKKQAQLVERIKRLEAGFTDGAEFERWQSKMLKMDEENQLIAIEERRLAGKLSYEQAILARTQILDEKRKQADEIRKEAVKLMRQYAVMKLKEEEKVKQKKESVGDNQDIIRKNKEQIRKYKAKIVRRVKAENRELMKRALEEAEIEMQQKMELIRQIRLLEMNPIVRFKRMDPTAHGNHGVMCEMSLSELRTRLFTAKQQRLAEEEEKRDEIITEKQEKEKELMFTLAKISAARQTQAREAGKKLETAHKRDQERKLALLESQKINDLRQKLVTKMAQRRQAKERLEIIQPGGLSLKRMEELQDEKRQQGRMKWHDMQLAKERMGKIAGGLIESSVVNRITRSS